MTDADGDWTAQRDRHQWAEKAMNEVVPDWNQAWWESIEIAIVDDEVTIAKLNRTEVAAPDRCHIASSAIYRNHPLADLTTKLATHRKIRSASEQ